MKIYVTPPELDKLKGTLRDYGYLEEVKYRQVNKIDYDNPKQQKVEFICNEHTKRKIHSHLVYYIYPFREKK